MRHILKLALLIWVLAPLNMLAQPMENEGQFNGVVLEAVVSF